MIPPIVLPMTEANENIDAPNNAGTYPPIVEPMITPIMMMVLVDIRPLLSILQKEIN